MSKPTTKFEELKEEFLVESAKIALHIREKTSRTRTITSYKHDPDSRPSFVTASNLAKALRRATIITATSNSSTCVSPRNSYVLSSNIGNRISSGTPTSQTHDSGQSETSKGVRVTCSRRSLSFVPDQEIPIKKPKLLLSSEEEKEKEEEIIANEEEIEEISTSEEAHIAAVDDDNNESWPTFREFYEGFESASTMHSINKKDAMECEAELKAKAKALAEVKFVATEAWVKTTQGNSTKTKPKLPEFDMAAFLKTPNMSPGCLDEWNLGQSIVAKSDITTQPLITTTMVVAKTPPPSSSFSTRNGNRTPTSRSDVLKGRGMELRKLRDSANEKFRSEENVRVTRSRSHSFVPDQEKGKEIISNEFQSVESRGYDGNDDGSTGTPNTLRNRSLFRSEAGNFNFPDFSPYKTPERSAAAASPDMTFSNVEGGVSRNLRDFSLGDKVDNDVEDEYDDSEEACQRRLIRKYAKALQNICPKFAQRLAQSNGRVLLPYGPEFLDDLIDVMVFGIPDACEECPKGQFTFVDKVGYICFGCKADGTFCMNATIRPNKSRPFVYEELVTDPYTIFANEKFRIREREFKGDAVGAEILKFFEHYYNRSFPPDDKRLKLINVWKEATGTHWGELQKARSTKAHGVEVDGNCVLKGVAHVLRESNKDGSSSSSGDAGAGAYDANLSLTEVRGLANFYVKMQVLESNFGEDWEKFYWYFVDMGRVGGDSQGVSLSSCARHDGIRMFEQEFLNLTGNKWSRRTTFTRHAGKYAMVEVVCQDVVVLKDKVRGIEVPSQLTEPVQSLVSMIFDEAEMKKAMRDLEIDVDRMPLGAISQKQIQKGYAILNELCTLLRGPGSKKNKKYKEENLAEIEDLTNDFYSNIPHKFECSEPPILDNIAAITEKNTMLGALSELEIACSILKQGGDSSGNYIDFQYSKLNSNIEAVPRNTDAYALISQYATKSHSSLHTFKIKILEVYKVSRHIESERYKPYAQYDNRKLLWHGSLTTNFAGILSQGLRIAPPEAPVTGYMFGKGIYFADMISKSAQYCKTGKKRNGLILLCQVALGTMKELYDAKNYRKPPKGSHSVKGVGRLYPDPAQSHIRSDGVEIPLGNVVETKARQRTLAHNEYIVYDVAQVRIEYLIKIQMK